MTIKLNNKMKFRIIKYQLKGLEHNIKKKLKQINY